MENEVKHVSSENHKLYVINYYYLLEKHRWFVELEEPIFHKIIDRWQYMTKEEVDRKIKEIKNMYPEAITAQFNY